MANTRKLLFFFALSLIGNFSFGFAPESIMGRKITFLLKSELLEDSDQIVFYPYAEDSVYSYEKSSGEWYIEKISWKKVSKNIVNLTILGDAVNESSTQVSIAFNDDMSGSFSYLEDDGESGIGTFIVANFSTDEIPLNRYFTDLFYNKPKSSQLWPLNTAYGITKSIEDGSLLISGTLTDPDDRWYNIGANTLLNLSNNWVIKGTAFTDVNHTGYIEPDSWYYNDATIGVEISTGFNEVTFVVGISHHGITTSIWVENSSEYKGTGVYYPSRVGTFRLINSPTDKTVSSQYESNGTWKTIYRLNWETGLLTHVDGGYQYVYNDAAGHMSVLKDLNHSLDQWTPLDNATVSPIIRFEIPHLKHNSDGEFNKLVPFNKGDMGLTSFSIVGDGENATTFSSSSNDFIQQTDSNGWMWFENYPWVYSNKEKGWLYFHPRDSEIYIYNSNQMFWQTIQQIDSNGWMWFENYPWVYSNKEKGWLYFYPQNGEVDIYNLNQRLWQTLSKNK